ncbi:hypothetical protein PG911_12195 [Tenacibaculum ovolyticum]|uniref:hypothetical protein n=1 Tax=Tenacibaculum ovolyticum TaxID=104270 RepID=UPI0022F3933B|nr:hypothetical protein [Tenacibaculum ovolyticum]WBX75415.1 hypothetical protein PG911_12195 [Tenacibaculum ovolyticum]
MKTVLTTLLVITLITITLLLLANSRKKEIKQQEQDRKLLTIENYQLIRDSPYTDKLSKHIICREKDKLKFTSESGYTRFYLEINRDEPNSIKLIGLDGYGIRNREFLKYTANLIRKIHHA